MNANCTYETNFVVVTVVVSDATAVDVVAFCEVDVVGGAIVVLTRDVEVTDGTDVVNKTQENPSELRMYPELHEHALLPGPLKTQS